MKIVIVIVILINEYILIINKIHTYVFLIIKTLVKLKGILEKIEWLLSFQKTIFLLKYEMGHLINIFQDYYSNKLK